MLEIAFALNWGILAESGHGLAPFSLKVNLVKRLSPFTDRVMGCPTCSCTCLCSARDTVLLLGQSPFSVPDCMSLPFSPQYFLFFGGGSVGERCYFGSLGIVLFKNRRLWSDGLCSLSFGNGYLITFALVIKVSPPQKKILHSSPIYFSHCVVNIFQCEMKTKIR